MTTARIYNVLFLGTGNSARSILAEALIEHRAAGRFKGFSAGINSHGHLHPLAIELLDFLDIRTETLRSKSWDEFNRSDAPVLDFVFTVCHAAAIEARPFWRGNAITARWDMPDPAGIEGTNQQRRGAFRDAYRQLDRRLKLFMALPLDELGRDAIQRRVSNIGKAT